MFYKKTIKKFYDNQNKIIDLFEEDDYAMQILKDAKLGIESQIKTRWRWGLFILLTNMLAVSTAILFSYESLLEKVFCWISLIFILLEIFIFLLLSAANDGSDFNYVTFKNMNSSAEKYLDAYLKDKYTRFVNHDIEVIKDEVAYFNNFEEDFPVYNDEGKKLIRAIKIYKLDIDWFNKEPHVYEEYTGFYPIYE